MRTLLISEQRSAYIAIYRDIYRYISKNVSVKVSEKVNEMRWLATSVAMGAIKKANLVCLVCKSQKRKKCCFHHFNIEETQTKRENKYERERHKFSLWNMNNCNQIDDIFKRKLNL